MGAPIEYPRWVLDRYALEGLESSNWRVTRMSFVSMTADKGAMRNRTRTGVLGEGEGPRSSALRIRLDILSSRA